MLQGDTITERFSKEMKEADEKYGPFKSSHEGLGVLLEEFHELRDAIHRNDTAATQVEAIQIAAVAMRIAVSLTSDNCRNRSTPDFQHDNRLGQGIRKR